MCLNGSFAHDCSNPEMVNILLQVFDKLREMLNNHQQSNDEDISEFVLSLVVFTASYLPPAEKKSPIRTVNVTAPGYRSDTGSSLISSCQEKRQPYLHSRI